MNDETTRTNRGDRSRTTTKQRRTRDARRYPGLPTAHCDEIKLPIRYHTALAEGFDGWAADIGQEPSRLWRATIEAIRSRHHEAQIARPSHGGSRYSPNVYSLALDSLTIFFSIEPTAVTIRGYGWELARDALDDFEGGGFYAN